MSDWTYNGLFLGITDADALYHRMMAQPWTRESPERAALHFGLSYKMFGGAQAHEIPTIPPFLMALSQKVSAITKHPVNYVQCHRFGPMQPVRPHEDPRGMCVPMVVVGQQRTFRVGGTLDIPRSVRQSERKVEWHWPEEEILMEHGSLLVFNGGRTIHSMHVATEDRDMASLGFDWRISLLFRFTTPSMRKFGPGKNVNPAEYAQAVRDFQASGQMGLFA